MGASARLAGVRSVHVSLGNPAPCDRPRQRKWRTILRLSSVLGVPVHSCSVAVEQSFRELGAGLPRGSGVIPNGCDVAGIAERGTPVRALRPRGDRLVIGMVARLHPMKDQATLIRAFAEVAKQHPRAELWLIGDGTRAGELCALAVAEGVADRVVFWGPRRDVPELLGRLDVFAFSTTRDEGFGIALIEAMAAGLPVVASDVPACREVLADGEAGRLVPAGDPDALATELRALLRDPGLRAAWAARATAHVGAYTAERCAADWYRLLLA